MPTSQVQAELEYVRVRIDRPTTAEATSVDADSRTACVLLDKALALRRRWQSAFVVVDPDEKGAAMLDSPMSSPRRGPKAAAPFGMQRRAPPEFNPFAVPVPPASSHTMRVVDGVYQVDGTFRSTCLATCSQTAELFCFAKKARGRR